MEIFVKKDKCKYISVIFEILVAKKDAAIYSGSCFIDNKK